MRAFLIFFLVACAFVFLPSIAQAGCLDCHDGIEKISEVPAMAELSCVDCHKGNPDANEMDNAHSGMYANPTDLRVVDKTCGSCHPEEVAFNKKSLHSTMAGMISGTRYAFGTQDRTPKYATYAIKDDDPKGKFAIRSLRQIPSYDPSKPEGPDNSPGDDYLRNQCLRCHLWSDGHQRDGDWRASGCAACHMVYSDMGTYEGGDKAIDKSQKDRPMFHRITSKIPEYQCIHCHNRGGRTGVSFIGTIESDGYGSPWTASGGKQGKLHGKQYNHLTADVHFDKGMTCIDCHTKAELHGDGNIYGKREEAVEIECEDCHGTMESISNLKTSWGNPFTNLAKEGNRIILTSKMDGSKHEVPQISRITFTGEGNAAMVVISTHMEKMECYACHARWAPQCYGCHAKQDIAKPSGDWLVGKPDGDPSAISKKNNRQSAAYSWAETRSYVRWETPTLGINTEGLVSPFIPGCQVFFTQMDGKKNIVNNKVFRTVDGTSGFGHNPVYPHTTSKKSRSCMDCHGSTKALGLGGGYYKVEANFPDGSSIDFELERIVDEEGKQIQQTSHKGARPFNKAEQERISRVGTCIACHGVSGKEWRKIQRAAGTNNAPTDKLHQRAIKKLIK